MVFANPEGLPLYLLDRSRLECAAECPRKYFWLYQFLGVGIVKIRELPPYWPFHTGTFIHEGVESVLRGVPGKEAAEKAASDYYNKWAPIVTQPDISPENSAILMMELEQEVDLVKALVYGWATVGYPRFLANYTVIKNGIEQEEEISWLIDDGTPGAPKAEMRLLTRTDILAKANSTGMVHLFNLKSVKEANEKWRTGFQRDMQTLTEAMAVESRLGFKVDGVIIEGLIKGKNNEYPKGSGFWQSQSMLIYAWVKEADATSAALPGEVTQTEYATSWDYTCTSPHIMGNHQHCPGGRNHTLGKGYRKRAVRDCFPGGVFGWLDYLNRNDPEVLASYFIQLPAINRDEFQVARWVRQKLHREKERQDNAAKVNEAFERGDKDTAYALLDHTFNMNEGYQCFDCAYNSLCWEAGNPLDEDVWRARVPNHLAEAERLVQISNAST